MATDCPKCGLLNPSGTARCDCGFDFVSNRVERSYARPAGSANSDELGMTLSQVGVRNIKSGILLFIVAVVVSAVAAAASSRTGYYFVAVGALFSGAIQFIRGCTQYRRGR
jgi:hypothetical protein